MKKSNSLAKRTKAKITSGLNRLSRRQRLTLIIAAACGAAIILATILAIVFMQRPSTTKLSSDSTPQKTAEIKLPDGTSNTTEKLSDQTIYDVVLANQPAVVRIVTLGCGGVSLSSAATNAQFGHVCAGALGSGSIISSDGYVATNGHVVDITSDMLLQKAVFTSQDNLVKAVEFLRNSGKITTNQAASLIDSYDIEEITDALDTFIDDNMIQIASKTTHYGVQLGNDPLRIKEDLSSISYTETIVPATLIGMNYDPNDDDLDRYTASDAALLKIDAEEIFDFPMVELGSTDDLHRGDEVTAIGFPGVIDNGARTTKWQTIPSITRGVVQRIANNTTTGGYKLIITSAQIGQGSSGGPLFNDDGLQIGINTYGDIQCEDSSQCLGDGTARDIDDVKQLMTKYNVKEKSGAVDKTWRAGLAAYRTGDYRTAANRFEKVSALYPANYLAPELARMARAQIDGDEVSHRANWLSILLIILVVVMSLGLIAVLIIVVRQIHKRRQHNHNHGAGKR